MGPADSEPLLISLAAELEAVNGWVTKQPEPWWTEARRGRPEAALRRKVATTWTYGAAQA